MSEQKKTKFNDIFIAESIYPDVESIFEIFLKKLENIKDDCYVVLDTNVLLLPYKIGKESLSQIKKTYKDLIDEDRLVIPSQVAREFAKNKPSVLLDLYQNLCNKRNKSIQVKEGTYPLLESLDKYQELTRIESEIDNKLREYRKVVEEVLTHIREWTGNDPVSLLYAELFPTNVILNPEFNKEDVIKDLERRQQHRIPPGYEDASKPDSGIGDLLIWYTILEIGKTHKKSVIFVSGEKKSDWWERKGDHALYPRHELLDEFRRCSGGQSFHIIELSHLLKLYGASETVVKEVRQEEEQIPKQNRFPNTQSERISIHVRDETNSRVTEAQILFINPNGTHRELITLPDGLIQTRLPNQIYTVFCAHPRFPAYIEREFEPVRSLEVRVSKRENTGSIIFLGGTGYIPRLQGRLNPIRDNLNRLYLYADNIAIEGGQQQPVDFFLGQSINLEDCNGKVRQIRILEVIGESSLIEFVEG